MLNLVMVLHCHQPIGNFDHVFQKAFKMCYQPLLDRLDAHPSVRVGLHFSGPLLEWIEQNHAHTLDRIADLVERDQVEMLSGGFFEPLLATIPVEDAKGQVLMMNDYIARRFGRRPSGFWLAERIWDPGLPLTLSGTGMSYTVVDDTHFYYSGLKSNEIYGYYVTEKEGHTLNLLATPMIMRYLIPFQPVEDVIAHLENQDAMGRNLVLYGDDGEKFGLWPGTFDWVIQKGWLDNFFSALEDNSGWLRTVLPGVYVASIPPLGRIYLPQASYEEMTEWALPSDRRELLEDIIATLKKEGRWNEWRPFIRGGIWDNFLVKYDESNRMHKKMLFLSEELDHDQMAREYLWRAQCNCAYWHGVFGGLYLGHLRRAVHENLIRAQKHLIHKSQKIHLFQQDMDKDGTEEIIIWTPRFSLGLTPHNGGGLFEICYLPRELNLSDTLTRRHEAYHRHLLDKPENDIQKDHGIVSIHDLPQVGDEDLQKALIFDSYTKISLLDHFLDHNVTVEQYAANQFSELGDFVEGHYSVEVSESASDTAIVKLERTGNVGNALVIINKVLRVENDAQITVDYRFECLGSDIVSARYGCEFNLTLYSDQDENRYYEAPDIGYPRKATETGEESGITKFELVNRPERLTTRFIFSRAITVWFYPIITVSKSEEGFERTYQGSNLTFHFPMHMTPGQKEHLQIQIQFIES